MAKDGTQRGGKRAGSGRKSKSKMQRILDGAQERSLQLYTPEDDEDQEIVVPDLPDWMPKSKKMQLTINGVEIEVPELETERVFRGVWTFLSRLAVVDEIGPHILQMYAFEVARYIQAEQIISLTGFTVPHPTTGAPMASPFVSYSMSYLKQANILWAQISQIVREKWDGTFSNFPQAADDMMERLLRGQGL